MVSIHSPRLPSWDMVPLRYGRVVKLTYFKGSKVIHKNIKGLFSGPFCCLPDNL